MSRKVRWVNTMGMWGNMKERLGNRKGTWASRKVRWENRMGKLESMKERSGSRKAKLENKKEK